MGRNDWQKLMKICFLQKSFFLDGDGQVHPGGLSADTSPLLPESADLL